MDSSAREPLFLFDDDLDVEFIEPDRAHEEQASNAKLDSTEPIKASGAFDLETYQKESLARHREELNRSRKPVLISRSVPESSPLPDNTAGYTSANKEEKVDKKARQKPIRLDEGLLLSSKGIPQLIHATKDFKIKGKGHETTDLSRLLQVYRFWAHQLYPKTQFKDTTQRIEKLCHSRRMLSALSVWRDEAHGKLSPDVRSEGEDLIENLDDEVVKEASAERVTVPSVEATDETSAPSNVRSYPPTSGSELDHNGDDVSDTDMDVLIKEYSNAGQGNDDWWQDQDLEEYFTASNSAPVTSGVVRASIEADQSRDDANILPLGTKSPIPVEEDWGEDMYI
ncbi:hypothetical protein AX17_003373 [Amanita inopinata Kibby_2008]|nr:hypothetical protein AX17_003373 [Amanita inopinata Kibby_2008]